VSDISVAEHWLPPSPHREAVLDVLSDGRAHLVERGHRVPPLLVFEDGGSMELPNARYELTRRGWCLVAADEDGDSTGSGARGQTRHYDVCGCIDEIRGHLSEAQTVAAADPTHLTGLLDDASRMIERLHRRRQRYAEFAARLAALAAELEPQVNTADADLERATLAAWEVQTLLRKEETLDDALRERLHALLEEVRAVAQGLEDALAQGKRTALALLAEYEAVRGGRAWRHDA
jgi:hypothetical protein